MKRLLAVVLASGCGRVDFAPLADASPVLEADAPSSDLVLHFAFDAVDPRVDSAQVPHPGACTECPSITAGRVGAGAAAFDFTQCLEIPGSNVLQPATFTIAAWARPRFPHHATIVGRAQDGATEFTNTFEIWVDQVPTWNVAMHEVRTLGGYTPGEWHHYAGTFDGSEAAAFVDGARVDRNPAVPTAYTTSDVTIGCDLNLGALAQRFDGEIDDVRLYSRVLMPAEIAALAAL